jgi:hypothetical protein
MRAMALALFVLIPNVAAGQTSPVSGSAGEGRESLTVQIAAGPTLVDRGNVMSVAFGYLPAPRLELLLNAEFDRMSLRFERVRGANTAVRGGTMSFVSVEMRAALRPADLVSPFALLGIGGGVSRPRLPERGSKDMVALSAGGGVRVPVRRGFSLWTDARMIYELDNEDGVPVIWPVRAGLAWRF